MLVLSRRESEEIFLIHRRTGERIRITTVSVVGDKTRTGIDADQDWQILRGEIMHLAAMPEPAKAV